MMVKHRCNRDLACMAQDHFTMEPVNVFHPTTDRHSRSISCVLLLLIADAGHVSIVVYIATPLSIQSMTAITQHDGHALMHPCPGLHGSRIIIIFTMERSTYSIPFRLGHSRSISCVLVAMLQPCGDVECNPGPSSPASNI